MDLAKTVRTFLKKKIFEPTAGIDLQNVIGWRSIGGSSTYGFYRDNQYENGYPSITKLANGFAMVEPYTIDKSTKSVPSNLLDRLYTPNDDMSDYDFREALATCFLVMDKVRIRVHTRDNVPATAETIVGFTFLENCTERIVGGQRDYMLANGEILTDKQVITIKSINPTSVTDGFSASRAARRWTRLDDYIADYQKGFFENGAIPAGEMIITARTKTEFNDIVDTLESKHKGASKNNNIVYSHRPTDQEGKPMNAQVEWIPYSSTNKDLSLKDLFDQVNKKIDSNYGVPDEIKGYLKDSNYASVAVAEKVFVKYALGPMTLKIWSKFNHELNRITGGTGLAFSYLLEIPVIADEEKVEAEAKSIDAQTVASLVTQGFTLDSAIEYVKTGNHDSLKVVIKPEKNDVDIVNAEDLKDVPNQPIDMYSKRSKQVSARDYETLYEGIDIDPDDLGCIMLKTSPFQVLNTVPFAENDLAEEVNQDRSPVPGEDSPHLTLLYGLLENGNVWKGKVDDLLTGWSAPTITIEDVAYFELPDSYAIIAHVKKTTDLLDGHDRLTLLPHINTFSEYRPHITLAYINKNADIGKWITSLGKLYNGAEIETAGLDYGDKPVESKSLKKKQLSEVDRKEYEDQLYAKVDARMTKQINRVIDNVEKLTKASPTLEEPVDVKENKLFSEELQSVLYTVIGAQGEIEHIVNTKLVYEAGIVTDDIKPFRVTPNERDRYNSYLDNVARNYNEETANKIRNVLSAAKEAQSTVPEIKEALKRLIDEKYRVQRLAVSEVNRGANEASLMSMKNIAADTGVRVEKEWVHDGSDAPCEFCQAMIGTTVPLSNDFVAMNGLVQGTDGGTFVNNFVPIQVAELHPNGHCRQVYRVIK